MAKKRKAAGKAGAVKLTEEQLDKASGGVGQKSAGKAGYDLVISADSTTKPGKIKAR